MARADRTAADSVDLFEALRHEPHAFHFFEALRRLECHYRDRPRLGKATRLSDDPVRLTQEPSMAFAPATLAGFDPGDESHPPHLAEYFLGLFGPPGAVAAAPDRIRLRTQAVLWRPHLFPLADVFHHRMLSLFTGRGQMPSQRWLFDRPEMDRFNTYIGAAFGLGIPITVAGQRCAPDLAKFHYAGRLACQTHNAEGLQALLGDFFHLPVTIENFVGHWLPLAESSQCRLGETPATGSLGMTAVIGERVWDGQYKFRIVVGRMSLAEFRRFLPGSASLSRIVFWVRNYLGDELLWDVNLVLRKEEARLKLGEEAQLGWTTWLTSQPLAHDADDLKLDAVTYCKG